MSAEDWDMYLLRDQDPREVTSYLYVKYELPYCRLMWQMSQYGLAKKNSQRLVKISMTEFVGL